MPNKDEFLVTATRQFFKAAGTLALLRTSGAFELLTPNVQREMICDNLYSRIGELLEEVEDLCEYGREDAERLLINLVKSVAEDWPQR